MKAENERLRAEVERLRADRDSWEQQASDRVADWHAEHLRAERLRAEVERLRRLVQERDTMLGKRLCAGTNADGKPRCLVLAEERARAERLAEALRELVEVFSESGMYDEEVFVKARAALDQGGGERAFWGPLPKVGGPDWTGYGG